MYRIENSLAKGTFEYIIRLMKTSISMNKYYLFTLFIGFFLGLEILGILATLADIFYGAIFIVYLILAVLFLIYLIYKNSKNIAVNNYFLAVVLISILAVSIFSLFFTPTIFSGRDQGSFSEAAIRLSQNHKLTFSSPAEREFFKIYGPGKALNFPGFSYTSSGELTTQFSAGYIAWLAVFYAVFGLSGFAVANGITLFIFLLSFYLLARNYLKKLPAFAAFLLALTCFVFSWFFKFTLNENLALMLVWFGILQFIWFWNSEDSFYLLFSLVAFLVLAFIRLEAFAFLLLMAILIFAKYRNWGKIFQKINNRGIIWLAGIFLIFYVWSFKVSSYYYLSAIKGFLNSFSAAKQEIGGNLGILSPFVYVLKIFFTYGLVSFLVIGFLAISYFILKKKYELIMPYLIVLPTFFYVFSPSISADHPWFLRRFVFAVIPASILLSVLLIDRLFKKKILKYSLLFLFLISNLVIFSIFLPLIENENLLQQTQSISQNFGTNDLVLVDRLATGNGWAMINGPLSFLYGKQAVYFFNPADLEKINKNSFDNIYFIIPDSNLELYFQSEISKKLEYEKDYSIATNFLDIGSGAELPRMNESVTYGKIFKLAK